MTRLVAGVDGCKKGWVAVILADGRLHDVRWIKGVDSEFLELEDVQAIAIDTPIGYGPRKADSLARHHVGGSVVFTIPEKAKFEGAFAAGRGIPKQTFDLGPRIAHVTGLAVEDKRFKEVHPELCFWAMNNKSRLKYRKKSSGGAFERMRLLRQHGIEIVEESLGNAGRVPLDDVLDAAAGAWSAARKDSLSLPDPPECRDGLEVAIWY